jgi:hypothetical protein
VVNYDPVTHTHTHIYVYIFIMIYIYIYICEKVADIEGGT